MVHRSNYIHRYLASIAPPSKEKAAPPSNETAGDPIALDKLVFEWPDDLESLRAPAHLVGAFEAPGDDLGQTLARFCEAVCPTGVPGTLIASNAESESGRPAWERRLMFRPVCEGPAAAQFGRNGFTLGLRAYRRQGRLVVERVEATPHVPKRDFEVHVSGVVSWEDRKAFMSKEDFESLGRLPDQRAKTRTRLMPWNAYLSWKESLIRAGQVSLSYVAYRWVADDRIAFLIEGPLPPTRRLEGLDVGFALPSPEADSDPADDDEAGEPRRPQFPKFTNLGSIRQVSGATRLDGHDSKLWQPKSTTVTPGQTAIVVQIDEDRLKRIRATDLPTKAAIMSSIAGDLAPLRNQRAGIDRLQRNEGFSPRLGDFLFSATSASVPAELPQELPPIEGGRELNEGQREAVLKALAAPDLCLIQGPPGTGKTTVIAEICLRAALAGQRVLIASQTNLAVDNALARLADQPSVRRLRLGDPERVDEEFKDFLATHVIDHWFGAVGEQCRSRVATGVALVAELEQRGQAIVELEGVARAHGEAARALRDLQATRKRLEAELAKAHHERKAAEVQLQALVERMAIWRELEVWASGSGSLPRRLAPLGRAIDIDEIAQLDRSAESLGACERLLDALETVRRAEGGDGSEELTQLRHRKLELSDATEDAELRELGEVNKRIKHLENDGWSKATGLLGRAARALYGDAHTPDIERIVGALRSGPETATALERATRLAKTHREEAERATTTRSRLREHYAASLAATGSEVEAADPLLRAALEKTQQVGSQLEQTDGAQSEVVRSIATLVSRWQAAWAEIPEAGAAPEPSDDAVAEARRRVEDTDAEHADERQRAERWSAIQREWAERLTAVSESDREQLVSLYVHHANVVGMTTNEAGKWQTRQSGSFRPFDVVVIDEVSKATPPELLLPMLLGKKVVLVGDHRQLPPMFKEGDATFGEASAEGLIAESEVRKYQRMVTSSLFQELFEQADERIKATLWTQYRMHPDIMNAVNQFYEGRLLAGPDAKTLASRRPHHLRIEDRQGGVLLDEGQHLLWVDSSQDGAGRPSYEEQVGSSKRNQLEVELVIETVLGIGRSLSERGFRGDRPLTVGSRDAGMSLREVIVHRCPDLPSATLDELFEERRVRIGGRAQKPSVLVQPGQTVLLQARREVGVVSFYGAQLTALRERLNEAKQRHPEAFSGIDLRTNTVDRFQGMEKSIVIASLVRATKGQLGKFVREYQRINVGLSRAQRLLVIVGAIDTWKHAQVPLPPIAGGSAEERPVYANILDHVRVRGGRRTARQLLAR